MSFPSFISTPGQKILFWFIIGAIGIYLLFRWLKKKTTEYYKQEYWENRYSWYTQEMDWYTGFSQINKDFLIEAILKEKYPHKNKCNILELGCGNSSLSYGLYQIGYKQIISIDFSPTVISQMKAKYGESTSISYLCVDFNRMDKFFDENQFDVIIEKAGLDSIAVRNSPDVPKLLFNIYEKMHKVLKVNGIVLSISSKNPVFWKNSVLNKLVDNKMFEIIQIKKTVFTNPKNPTLMNLYFYYLQKVEK